LILALAGVHSLSTAGAKPFLDKVFKTLLYLYSWTVSEGNSPGLNSKRRKDSYLFWFSYFLILIYKGRAVLRKGYEKPTNKEKRKK
jgi:hypothetical protein